MSDYGNRAAGFPDVTALYLDLLKSTLTDMIHIDDPVSAMVPWRPRTRRERYASLVHAPFRAALRLFGIASFRLNRGYKGLSAAEIRHLRTIGMDWPARAHTMVGMKRLDNLQSCVETALKDGVPGDFIETGVWRGGASIFVKGVLAAHGDKIRHVWLADSFRG